MKIVALAGGVGGAKLADGLARVMHPDDLTIIVNTGDDFEHLGFFISPDLDTVCYTLAGIANPLTGWGQEDDTFNMLDSLSVLGGETWFRLGDKDLATHIERTRRIQLGQKLSEITKGFCQAWDIKSKVLPMTDDVVRTMVQTTELGDLAFQDYFVKKQCLPIIYGFYYLGIEKAKPAEGIIPAIQNADGIIICPSNPWLSIDPILAIDGIRSAVSEKKVVAVSPILGGKALKGPAAKIFKELNIQPSAFAVQQHYGKMVHGFIIDSSDEIVFREKQLTESRILGTNIIMKTTADRQRLAENVLNFIVSI